MNNTHTKAMKAHAFAGSALSVRCAWACPAAAILGLVPAYRADSDTIVAMQGGVTIQTNERGADPPSSPS